MTHKYNCREKLKRRKAKVKRKKAHIRQIIAKAQANK